MTASSSSVAQGPAVSEEELAALKWLEENLIGDFYDIRSRLGQKVAQSGLPKTSKGKSPAKQTDPFRQLRAAWDLGKEDLDQRIVNKINELLKTSVQNTVEKKSGKVIVDIESCEMTVMHIVAFVGLPGLMEMLAEREQFLQQIIAQDCQGQTPLHLASLTGSLETVKFLTEQEILRADVEDNLEQTAFEIADEVGWHEIVRVLLRQPDVQHYLSKRRSERTMYGDGTNAILVGAALIASITFAGWLQPPLGYQKYYQYPRNSTMSLAPPDDFQQYAAIVEHTSVKIFWITNSLSFYFAIAAILAGAGAMVPRRGLRELAEVKRKRGAAYLTGFVFSWAVVFVVAAFTAAGIASLPPILSYEAYMISTFLVGCCVCIYGFSSARMSDPSAFLKYLKLIDPAWHVSNLSWFFERLCGPPLGYRSFESRTQERKGLYNSNSVSSQGGCLPGLTGTKAVQSKQGKDRR